ncbi:hypothetical protein RBWH47_03053 [Rhodopirellula baltica WH47]|uniref:Uncharacterized protein n=3 Tax=Rhodopirellula baltica TaxID=265606 RepID=Q7UWV4_RHOBA|nr:hypothetical protein RBWH47_03053 [Rhodopirellula baltica WH47]ELP32667.1 hypothetical protein RBSWK_03422 [Rhodopirellula baltica SWK14]CAD72258.1 hypothetical protein RB1766 [Rhodopirellula baltica SH 1]
MPPISGGFITRDGDLQYLSTGDWHPSTDCLFAAEDRP